MVPCKILMQRFTEVCHKIGDVPVASRTANSDSIGRHCKVHSPSSEYEMRSPYLCLKTKSHEPTRSHIVCYDILNAYISEGLKILRSNQNQSQALFNTKLLKLQRTPQILFKIFPVFNMQFIKFPSSIHHTHANDLCFPTEKLVFDHNDNLLLLLHIKHIMEFQTSEQRLNHIEETY